MHIFIFTGITTFKEMFIKELVGRKTPVTMKISTCLCCKSCWGLICNSDNVIKLITISRYIIVNIGTGISMTSSGLRFTARAEWMLINLQLSRVPQRIYSQWDHEARSIHCILLIKRSFTVCEEKLIVKYKWLWWQIIFY